MKAALVTLISALSPLTAEPYSHNWRHTKPVVHSEVQKLNATDANELMAHFCAGRIRTLDKIGLECSTRHLGPAFQDIVDNTFHPETVVYGHFLSAGGEDAAVSGWSAEHHPELWRGTLLLTKRRGVWTPVWYKSSVITHSCRKLARSDGREVLLCEEEDGGMGHRLHYLYSVDLTKPVDIRDSLLAVADSFESSCVILRQQIHQVEWIQAELLLAVTIRSPQWRRLSRETCAGDPSPQLPPPLNATLHFHLGDSGFRRVQARAKY